MSKKSSCILLNSFSCMLYNFPGLDTAGGNYHLTQNDNRNLLFQLLIGNRKHHWWIAPRKCKHVDAFLNIPAIQNDRFKHIDRTPKKIDLLNVVVIRWKFSPNLLGELSFSWQQHNFYQYSKVKCSRPMIHWSIKPMNNHVNQIHPYQ